MSRPIEQASYYTPPSMELVTAPSVVKTESGIPSSKAVRRLTGNLLDAYSVTKVFNNGDPFASPREGNHKRGFEETINAVAWEKASDLLTPEGNVISETNQEWINVLDIAPQLTAIMLRNQHSSEDEDTDAKQNNYISGVNREAVANVAGLAIDIARNPELLSELVISTGFGGSDNEFTSTRFPAYMLPSLKMVREMRAFYTAREDTAVSAEIRNKVYNSLQAQERETTGQEELDKPTRRRLNQEAATILEAHREGEPTDMTELFELTEEELAAARDKYGIATQMPTVRFFFGSQAAIAINHTMEPEGIRRRVAENLTIMDEFVNNHFPDVADTVQFIEDKPWSEHSLYQRTVVEYLASVLRESDDPSIVSTLETMKRLGENHGGDNGSQRSAEYAAIHPLIFGDRLNIPYASFLNGVPTNSRYTITIGGPTERKFTALRRHLTEHADPEDLLKFIETKRDATEDLHEQRDLDRIAGQVNMWIDRVSGIRTSLYEDPNAQPVRPDRPEIMVELATGIGELPTYYVRDGDRPYGSDIREQIVDLSQPIDETTIPEHERLHTKLARKAVLFDLHALQREGVGSPV